MKKVLVSLLLALGSPLGLADTLTLPGQLAGKAVLLVLDNFEQVIDAAPLVADLQGGHIAAGCGGITDFLEHHRAGKVKVIFTSGGTEADNLAIRGVHEARGGTVVTVAHEHHAVHACDGNEHEVGKVKALFRVL